MCLFGSMLGSGFGLGTGIVASLPEIGTSIVMRCPLRTTRCHAFNVFKACQVTLTLPTATKF